MHIFKFKTYILLIIKKILNKIQNKMKKGDKMKKTCEQLQIRELQDVLWFMQASCQLKEYQCMQLSQYFKQIAKHKFYCAMHLKEFTSNKVEALLREACERLEMDCSFAYQDCCLKEEKVLAITTYRQNLYMKMIEFLHDCVTQEQLTSYRCVKCGYEHDKLDEYCPICHSSQAYFMKQE